MYEVLGVRPIIALAAKEIDLYNVPMAFHVVEGGPNRTTITKERVMFIVIVVDYFTN